MQALPVRSAGSPRMLRVSTAAPGRAAAPGPASHGPAASSSSFPGGAGRVPGTKAGLAAPGSRRLPRLRMLGGDQLPGGGGR